MNLKIMYKTLDFKSKLRIRFPILAGVKRCFVPAYLVICPFTQLTLLLIGLLWIKKMRKAKIL